MCLVWQGCNALRLSNLYKVTLQRMAVNLPAVERQHGLELMLGRNAALAAVMGPDEDIASTARRS